MKLLPVAVAVAGVYLEINPFDQPDVQAAKDKTKEVLAAGKEPDVEPEGSIDKLLAQAQENDYVCVRGSVLNLQEPLADVIEAHIDFPCTWSRTEPEMQIPPGSANASSLAATPGSGCGVPELAR